MGVASGNVGLAFGLVIAAGLSTTVGSAFVFCSDLASKRTLAAALGLSAGVMVYVSFAEIFCVKAVEGFAAEGYSGDEATRYATLCFFAGIAVTVLMDRLVHLITDLAGEAPPTCCEQGGEPLARPSEHAAPEQQDVEHSAAGEGKSVVAAEAEAAGKDLKRMGLMTGLAIGLHNFPEGLATFVATLADEKLGIAVAFAIALHNIPEGLCVAMPVYFSTGSKLQGFMWSLASGISEPIGGLIGYLVLYGNNMSDVAYGVLFALVAGIMVYISIVELIPTALRYDPENQVVSKCFCAGMAVMAASLLAFTA